MGSEKQNVTFVSLGFPLRKELLVRNLEFVALTRARADLFLAI